MRRIFSAAVVLLVAASPVMAGDKGTSDEAVALAKKTIAAIKSDGADKTYAAITAKDPRFIDRDLYVIAYDLNGKCLASGSNPKMVGKDNLDTQDTDGKLYIKERMELGKSKGSFWQDYKFPNPVTKKVEPKSTYCEVVADAMVCVGIYK